MPERTVTKERNEENWEEFHAAAKKCLEDDHGGSSLRLVQLWYFGPPHWVCKPSQPPLIGVYEVNQTARTLEDIFRILDVTEDSVRIRTMPAR